MPAIQFDLPGVDLSAKRANLYGLEAQSRQNALDEQARQIKARNLYGDAMAGGATPQDMTQMYADQGIPMEGQQMVNQMGTLQRQAPNRQALQSGVMFLSTLPDSEVVPAYKALKAHAADQGMDTSFLPDESKIVDKNGNPNPSALKSSLMSVLDPAFGEKVMQYKELTEARKYQTEMMMQRTRETNQTRQSISDQNNEAKLQQKNITVNGLTPEENQALNNAISNGLDPYKVNSRTAKIYAQQEMVNPGRKWNELGAQASFQRSPATSNTKALLNTIDPLLDKLDVAGKDLGNMTSPTANRVANWFKENVSGDPKLTAFKNLRDDTVAEIERGLMNTGVLSDSKYNRAIKNVSESANYQQLQSAIKNTRTVIHARLESLSTGPYPNANKGNNPGQQSPSMGKLTDPVLANRYLEQAGGDADQARILAQKDGWEL